MGPGNETLAGQVPNLFQEPDGHLQQEEGKEQPRECVCVWGGRAQFLRCNVRCCLDPYRKCSVDTEFRSEVWVGQKLQVRFF